MPQQTAGYEGNSDCPEWRDGREESIAIVTVAFSGIGYE